MASSNSKNEDVNSGNNENATNSATVSPAEYKNIPIDEPTNNDISFPHDDSFTYENFKRTSPPLGSRNHCFAWCCPLLALTYVMNHIGINGCGCKIHSFKRDPTGGIRNTLLRCIPSLFIIYILLILSFVLTIILFLNYDFEPQILHYILAVIVIYPYMMTVITRIHLFHRYNIQPDLIDGFVAVSQRFSIAQMYGFVRSNPLIPLASDPEKPTEELPTSAALPTSIEATTTPILTKPSTSITTTVTTNLIHDESEQC